MNERDVRNKAKDWIVKNNVQLNHTLSQEGLLKLIEEAFIAGNGESEEIIKFLENQVDKLQDWCDDLEDERGAAELMVEEMKERLDKLGGLSVAGIK